MTGRAQPRRTPGDRARRAHLAAVASGFDLDGPGDGFDSGIGSGFDGFAWWTPPYNDHEARPAGGAWDAVRVPVPLGERTLAVLRERTGAVVEDSGRAVLYWFVRPYAASGWDLAEVRVLGTGSFVVLPAVHVTDGSLPRWRVRPRLGCLLTHPAHLRAALQLAVRGMPGPPTCTGCARTAEPLFPCRPGGWVCRECAPEHLRSEEAEALAREHAARCPACRATGGPCALGGTLRQLYQAVLAHRNGS
ncbi:hypothetical protein RKE29_12390 [Streptomyces sp. B1866]|uniref:hypothetical protein n=1 Tax=Streptomyces sp. B1866 TaxID=3075431 RepID=UPI00288DC67F|nr:hypothetical protein [Streptomyces sp. B1866]MDT3397438.1 hypothetical protein [Streptomyces sp. B1866]